MLAFLQLNTPTFRVRFRTVSLQVFLRNFFHSLLVSQSDLLPVTSSPTVYLPDVHSPRCSHFPVLLMVGFPLFPTLKGMKEMAPLVFPTSPPI